MLVWLLELPFDKTIMYHRWLGRFTIILVLFHVFWYWPDWFETGQFEALLLTDKNVMGMLALAAGDIFHAPFISR